MYLTQIHLEFFILTYISHSYPPTMSRFFYCQINARFSLVESLLIIPANINIHM